MNYTLVSKLTANTCNTKYCSQNILWAWETAARDKTHTVRIHFMFVQTDFSRVRLLRVTKRKLRSLRRTLSHKLSQLAPNFYKWIRQPHPNLVHALRMRHTRAIQHVQSQGMNVCIRRYIKIIIIYNIQLYIYVLPIDKKYLQASLQIHSKHAALCLYTKLKAISTMIHLVFQM